MPAITFENRTDKLILIYEPERMGINDVEEYIEKEGFHLRKTFFFDNTCNYEIKEEPGFDYIEFVIGRKEGRFYKLDKDIMGITHDFFLDSSIKFNASMFIAHSNISVMRKIDRFISEDFYLVKKSDDAPKEDFLSLDDFNNLLSLFPNSTELKKYSEARIAEILQEYFCGNDTLIDKYHQYISNYKTLKEVKKTTDIRKIGIPLFVAAKRELEDLLCKEKKPNEIVWQKKIINILRIIYPQYICIKKNDMELGNDGRHGKKPDFILVDTEGYVDLMEIKVPDVCNLLRKYRNNYVAGKELSGVVSQIEKYIYCINSESKKYEDKLKQYLKADVPEKVLTKIKVVNPRGIVILGRSNLLNEEELNDFELIKRQFKNIAEIMTYDDLLQRVENILAQMQE